MEKQEGLVKQEKRILIMLDAMRENTYACFDGMYNVRNTIDRISARKVEKQPASYDQKEMAWEEMTIEQKLENLSTISKYLRDMISETYDRLDSIV